MAIGIVPGVVSESVGQKPPIVVEAALVEGGLHRLAVGEEGGGVGGAGGGRDKEEGEKRRNEEKSRSTHPYLDLYPSNAIKSSPLKM